MPTSFGPLVDYGLRLGYSTKKASANISRPGSFNNVNICGDTNSRSFQFASSGQSRVNCDDIMSDRFLLTINATIHTAAATPAIAQVAAGLNYATFDSATFNIATFTSAGFELKAAQFVKGDIGGHTPEFTAVFSKKIARDVCNAPIGEIRSISVSQYEKNEDCEIIQSGSSTITWLRLDSDSPVIGTAMTALGCTTMLTNFLSGGDVVAPYTALEGTTISI